MATFAEIEDTFLYFAYGSNLLKKRIRINNPSAEFLGIGKLQDHQLDFMGYSDRWGGCSATIVPTPKKIVWGAIWRLHDEDKPALDMQEGVNTNWYFPKEVSVILPDGHQVQCRTYQQSKNPPPRRDSEKIPKERLPSVTYLEVIVNGAIECQIPEDYIAFLKDLPNNGNLASAEMLEQLKEKQSIPKNYRLDFIHYSHFWGGPESTVVPTANAHVWGVIWRIDLTDMVSLDDCKGINKKYYYYKYRNVLTPHMGSFLCRVYIAKVNPLPRGDNDVIPVERWPSWTYKEVLILGATEQGLPEYYIEQLKKLKDNGEEAYLRTVCLLVRYEEDENCLCPVPGRINRRPLQLDLKKRRDDAMRKK